MEDIDKDKDSAKEIPCPPSSDVKIYPPDDFAVLVFGIGVGIAIGAGLVIFFGSKQVRR